MSESNIGKSYFDSWVVVEKIGEGSFGEVYKVERNEFGTIYTAALKLIKIPQNAAEIENLRAEGSDDESIREYFEDFVRDFASEIALMAKLKGNSNIVSYEDHKVIELKDTIGWEIQIRMEFLSPLMKYYRSHKVYMRDVIKLGIDICKALEICQTYNIIHRDIKPENIFVSPNGDYKLGDFGIARTFEGTIGELSKKGTYYYMAPEVYKGEKYGTNIDIYSLGILLYRLFNCNKLPFFPLDKKIVSHKEREIALNYRMCGKELPAPVKATDRISEIILKACAYDPEKRYSSPTELRSALEAVYYSVSDTLEIWGGSDELDNFESVLSSIGRDSKIERDKLNDTDSGIDILNGTIDIYKLAKTEEIIKAEHLAEEQRKAREEAERLKIAEEERRVREEAERLRIAEEERKIREEVEHLRIAEEERKAREEAERLRIAEEERKAREEVERLRIAEEERKAREEAERLRIAEEERKAREEVEHLRIAEEERKAREEAEHLRIAEEEHIQKEEIDTFKKDLEDYLNERQKIKEQKAKVEAEHKTKKQDEYHKKAEFKVENNQETDNNQSNKKVMPIIAIIVVVIVIAIAFISKTLSDKDLPSNATSDQIDNSFFEPETENLDEIWPQKITGLGYKNVTASSVTLEWTEDENSELYYVFQWSDSKNDYVCITKDGITDTSYVVTGLSSNTKYAFKVQGYAKTIDNDEMWGEKSDPCKPTTNKVSSASTNQSTYDEPYDEPDDEYDEPYDEPDDEPYDEPDDEIVEENHQNENTDDGNNILDVKDWN